MSQQDAARGRDRSAAERLVRGAVASGRIIQADADLRLAAVKEARTVGDLELVTHDLGGPGGGLDSARPSAPSPYGPPQSLSTPLQVRAARAPGHTRGVAGLVVVVVALVVLGVAGTFVTNVSGGGPIASTDSLPSVAVASPHVLTSRGMDHLVRELAARTGSTTVFDAVLYPGYAVLEVPVRDQGNVSRRLYWNGSWDDLGRTNDTYATRIDLLTLRPRVVLRVLHGVESRLRQVKTSYVVIRHPEGSDPAVLYAYATSPSGRTVYAAATASGKVTYRSTS